MTLACLCQSSSLVPAVISMFCNQSLSVYGIDVFVVFDNSSNMQSDAPQHHFRDAYKLLLKLINCCYRDCRPANCGIKIAVVQLYVYVATCSYIQKAVKNTKMAYLLHSYTYCLLLVCRSNFCDNLVVMHLAIMPLQYSLYSYFAANIWLQTFTVTLGSPLSTMHSSVTNYGTYVYSHACVQKIATSYIASYISL